MERLGQLAWNTQSCKSATRAAALCGGQEIRSRLEIEGLPRMGALQDRETSREEAPSTFHTFRSVRPLQEQRLGELAGLVWNCLVLSTVLGACAIEPFRHSPSGTNIDKRCATTRGSDRVLSITAPGDRCESCQACRNRSTNCFRETSSLAIACSGV